MSIELYRLNFGNQFAVTVNSNDELQTRHCSFVLSYLFG